MTTAQHLRISGRVQGVGFRAWTVRTAVALGLRGWVRNRPDGRVEAWFEGEADAVSEMVSACGHGPEYARVDKVERITPNPETQEYDRFEIRTDGSGD